MGEPLWTYNIRSTRQSKRCTQMGCINLCCGCVGFYCNTFVLYLNIYRWKKERLNYFSIKIKKRSTFTALFYFQVLLFIAFLLFLFLYNHAMKFFSSIILLLIPFFLFSQGDTNLVNSLISKSDALSSENFQGAEKIAFQALEEALKTTDYICLAKANNNISELYKQKGNFSKSAHYLYLSGENYLKGGNDLKGFHSMNYAGYFYTVTGNFDKASEILLLVQKKAEQKQFKKALPMNYLAWGFLYRDMKKQEKAMEYFMKAHKIVKDSLGYYTVKFTSLNEIGNIYNGQKNYKYALKYQLQSLKIKEEIRDSVSIGYSFNDIGISYMLLGKLDSAKYYYGKTLQLAIETKNKHIESSANINFAELCKQEKKHKEGIEYANKGYVLAKEIQDAGMIQGSIQLLGYF